MATEISALQRNSSDVGWEFGMLINPKNPDKIKCKLCGKEFSGGVWRLKHHVAGLKGNVSACLQATTEQREKCKLAIRKAQGQKRRRTKGKDSDTRLEQSATPLVQDEQREHFRSSPEIPSSTEEQSVREEVQDIKRMIETLQNEMRMRFQSLQNEMRDEMRDLRKEVEEIKFQMAAERSRDESVPEGEQINSEFPEMPTTSETAMKDAVTEKGPRDQSAIAWPSSGCLTVEWVEGLMSAFDWSSRRLQPSQFPSLMPVDVCNSLILSASKIFHREPNCVRIDDIDSDSSVIVVGDIHGQLHDLLFLLNDAGFPGQNRFFVFNGDYVDRGAWGLETFLLLLAWKVLMPNRVYLLRGNHESQYCTSVYGFEKEVLAKYGDSGKNVYKTCLGCFQWLPLASIIGGRVYTAHGGLFRSTTTIQSKRSKGKKKRRIALNSETSSLSLGSLEELSKARRSVMDPPRKGLNLIPGDIMWSDPSMDPGLSPNEERGIGLLWGPDCTEDFLKKSNLKLIIRSHEGPDARQKRSGLTGMDEGYTIDHVVESGKLITLFSAPDYPQFQATEERYNNKGAYIVLQPPNYDFPLFKSFEAVTPRPKVDAYYDYEEVIDSDEELDLAAMATDDPSNK